MGAWTMGAHNVIDDATVETPDLIAVFSFRVGHPLHIPSSTGLAHHEAPMPAGRGIQVLVENFFCDVVGAIKVLDHSPCKQLACLSRVKVEEDEDIPSPVMSWP